MLGRHDCGLRVVFCRVTGVQVMAFSRSVRWRTIHAADLARQVMAQSASQSPACGVTSAWMASAALSRMAYSIIAVTTPRRRRPPAGSRQRSGAAARPVPARSAGLGARRCRHRAVARSARRWPRSPPAGQPGRRHPVDERDRQPVAGHDVPRPGVAVADDRIRRVAGERPGCQAAPAGGTKPAVASCKPRSRQPTWKTPSSLHACGLTDSPGMYVTTSSASALTGRGLPGIRPAPDDPAGRARPASTGRPGGGRVTVDHDRARLILHRHQCARRGILGSCGL